jgi:hypothetical protein
MSTSSTIDARPPEFQNCPSGVNLASKHVLNGTLLN